MRIFTILLVVALCSTLALAQLETGVVSGTVTDSTGAVVPGATVTVTSTGTGAARTATTNSTGLYTITNLQPGTYDMKVEGKGFTAAKRTVSVTVGSRSTVDVPLSTKGTTEVVEVIGTSNVTVETQSSELSSTVDSKRVIELPTFTRNPYDLVGTAGNVVEDNSNGTADSAIRGTGFSINGKRSASTDVLLDGAENVNLFTTQVGQQVPLDSVQEFKVTTSNFGAEYGRASGGVVNVATKSGTNAFHGSAYEFNRLSKLTSNDFDDNAKGNPRGTFTRNQFGYSIGGPIVKNKLFFFNSTEWTRVRSSAPTIALVPDPAFLALSNANTQAFFSAFGQLRSGLVPLSVLTAADLQGLGSPLCTSAPCSGLAATTPIFDRVSYGSPVDAGGGFPQNTYNLVFRSDWNITDKTTMYGRYTILSQSFLPGTVNDSPYAGFATGQTNFNNNLLVSLTHIFSPNLVLQSKFSYNRLNNLQPLGSNPVGPTLYLTNTVGATINGEFVNFPGYNQLTPGNAIPFGGPQNVGQAQSDLSWSRGKHQFRFGGSYIYTQDNRAFGAYEEAVESLGGGNKNRGINNFLAGNLNLFQAAVFPQGLFPCPSDNAGTLITAPSPVTPGGCALQLPVTAPSFSRSNRYHDWSLYMQDTWKIHPRLTLNLGMRYEYYGVQHNKDPRLDSNFVLASGSGLSFFDRVRLGQLFTVAATPNSPPSPVGGLWNTDFNNVAPRVGFAWDMFGDGKTSLRGGYGIAYERNFGNVTFNVIQNPPAYAVIALQSGVDIAQSLNVVTTSNAGPLAGTTGPTACPATGLLQCKNFPKPSLRYVRQDIPTAYSHFWNLAFEHELMKNTVVALEYTGSRGIHEYSIENINKPGMGVIYSLFDPVDPLGTPTPATATPPGIGGTTLATDRLNRQYSNMNTRGFGGFSYYNGLNLRFSSQNLWNQGLDITTNYTYAHAIDNLSSTFSEEAGNSNLGLLDPFNPGLDKGNADFDVRNRFVLSAIWTLPYAKNLHGIAKQVLDGWEFTPIWNARTGFPITAFDCQNELDSTSCARFIPSSAQAATGTSNGAEPDPNTFNFLTLVPAQPYANGTPVAPGVTLGDLVGAGELPTCVAPGVGPCTFPSNMSRRNFIRTPGFWNVNLGIYKNFKLTERFGLQFRSEFYNIFNHSNFYVIQGGAVDASVVTCYPGTVCTNPFQPGDDQFTIQGQRGVVPVAGVLNERRYIQFGLRLNF